MNWVVFSSVLGLLTVFPPIPTSGTGVAGFLRKDPPLESIPSHPAVYKTSMELPDDDKVRPPTYPRPPYFDMLVDVPLAAPRRGVCTPIESSVLPLHTRVTPV
jgi:hypothetical protein